VDGHLAATCTFIGANWLILSQNRYQSIGSLLAHFWTEAFTMQSILQD